TKFWEAVKKISFEELIEALESNIQVEKSDNIFIQASIPLWLKPFLMRSFPETSDLNHFLELQHKRPALWIRLNHSEKREEVLKELKANNFDVKTSEQENTLAIFGEKSVYQFETFQKGFFEVQDYASQQIGYALDIKPG